MLILRVFMRCFTNYIVRSTRLCHNILRSIIFATYSERKYIYGCILQQIMALADCQEDEKEF